MCDPITAITLGGAALSAAGSLYEGSQAASEQQDLVNKQNQANQEWLAYQQNARKEAQANEEAARQRADAARTDTLAKVGPEAQAAQQTGEQARLNTLYNEKGAGAAQNPNDPNAMLLSGEGTGNNKDVSGITSQINQATSQARSRIAALATANSYGGSFGGLGATVPLAFQQGGNEINLQNNERQGNLKVYGVQQQVQPLSYTLGPGTVAKAGLAKSLGSIAGTLASAGGTRAIGASGGSGGLSNLFSGFGGGGSGMPDDAGYIDDSMFV